MPALMGIVEAACEKCLLEHLTRKALHENIRCVHDSIEPTFPQKEMTQLAISSD